MNKSVPVVGPTPKARVSDRFMAIGVISAHTVEHIYGRSFSVLIPSIYVALGLSPLQAGAIEGIRQFTSGLVSIISGLFVDVFAHRRGQILAISFTLIAVGYFLVAIAPSYALIMLALALASAGAALWHPPALGLLAERFPLQRGLFISLHRSTGSIGDSIGPLLVGALLYFLGWRWIAGGGSPILLVVAALIAVLFWNVGGSRPESTAYRRALKTQYSAMKDAMKGTRMWAVFSVSALRGMGDTALVWVIPLYLSQELGKGSFVVGFHVALLAAPGIVSGPLFGVLSDRIGRKSIIIFIMATAVVLPIGMVLGTGGLLTTLSIATFGVFFFTVNSLTQAVAVDIAEGKRLEGTFIGLMWGSNAFFGAGSAIAAGLIVQRYGWPAAFYFASALFVAGFLASIVLPSTGAGTALGGGEAEV